MAGVGARGPVGRAHPISKSEKPSTSRDKDCRARGRDDKARRCLSVIHSLEAQDFWWMLRFVLAFQDPLVLTGKS